MYGHKSRKSTEGGELKSQYPPKPVRMLPIRVEDFLPFRQYIRKILAKRTGVKVSCEVSDGLEAVQAAEELKADLIFLDIGLPTMNGISAARQIRKVSPESRIILVSQDSSPDIVQEALNFGGHGATFSKRGPQSNYSCCGSGP